MKKDRAQKIGLLGGSFDPPHLGHLMIAQDAYESLELDEVWFIPSFLSPHKDSFHAEPEVRLKMVELMLESDPRFRCVDLEVKKGKPAFSVDTVKELRKSYPGSEFFWLGGADQLPKLHLWKEVGCLLEKVEFVILKRPGYKMSIPDVLKKKNYRVLQIHAFEVSSSEIRNRLARRLPVYMFLHPAVNEFIHSHQYYIQ